MSILITGSNGFVGNYLVKEFPEEHLFGIDIQEENKNNNISTYECVDITNITILRDFIIKNKINKIFHLAGIANQRFANENPLLAIKTNIIGTVNLFEICKENPDIRILVSGTSAVYDNSETFLSENSKINLKSFYTTTKYSIELLAAQYCKYYNTDIVITRSFNHTGPGQPPLYVIPEFAKQCAQIERGEIEPIIEVGNLKVKRDFLHVKDVVKAYSLLMRKGNSGEIYNVASGNSYLIQDLLGILLKKVNRKVKIEIDPEKYRENEVKDLKGDISKLRDLGWSPSFSIETLLDSVYTYWLKN
ncbi:MAG: GDP-mannose 4,6-dehydratase [Spirochaetales bacterium]|nr:GDP-mannose 4,6-dehydratase [Spirochaetales bacterium]